MDKPLVSVIIDNYNYGHFLREAIESALNQTYSNVEVIVVDDGSTDNSRQIIADYAMERKIIQVLKDNGGQASAFNAGFEVSRGHIICLLDSDDVFMPNKVERVVNLLSQHQAAEWLAHILTWSFPDGATCLPLLFGQPMQLQDFREAFSRGKLKAYFPATSGLCFRRSFLRKILPIPEEIRIAADNYLKFAAAGMGPVLLLDEPLAVQRIHGNNAYTLNPRVSPMIVEVHIEIAKNIKLRFPNAGGFSYRLAAHYVGRALTELGFRRGVDYARAASKALGYSPVVYGMSRILGRALLVVIRHKLVGFP